MNAISAKTLMTWPNKITLHNRLRASEVQRVRWGRIDAAKAPLPVAPIRHRECQWISGEVEFGKPVAMCCGPVVPGKSWCAAHDMRVFIPPFIAGEDENG